MIGPEQLVSDAELANLAGVSSRRIRQLAEQGTLERVGRGKFQLGPAVQSLIENAAGSGSELQRERTRKVKADADRAELAYAKEKGEVAPIAEAEMVWTRSLMLIRQRMRQVPARAIIQLIGEIDETRWKRALLAEIDQALHLAAEDVQGQDFTEDGDQ